MRMRTTLLTAVALLLAGIATAEARSATVTNDLNVRSGPGTGYRVVATLPAGARVNVAGCTGNNWCQIGGGYVSASYLSFGGSRVAVSPGYYDGYYDPALGVGAFALGVGVGSAWGPGYWGGPYYWGGPRYRYWGPGRYWGGRPAYWGGRPAYWRGGPGWRGRPAYWRGGPRPGWRGAPPPAWRGAGPGWRGGYGGPRPVMYRPQIGGMRRP
ncbi:SH3 domain-containing protein [Ancylobacter oerskovii]|uniref:SH3 domain-containing protein n=1 Tax=Ancylobacter oerskovii TaxID=459519 RepID=A0ABW4Z1N5_9HYPH|nr:SH3 domain-containing protein [Ancylobacter oerskovii]MBS7542715.1 SH3 domain-containing protein [Ancylobacter oerskovii]